MTYRGRQRLGRKQEMVIAASLLILILMGVASIAWKQHVRDNHNPIPAIARKGLSFPLYYPTNLPAGYSIKPNSFEQKDKVLIFYIMTPANKAVGVSQQSLPPGATLSQTNTGSVKIPGEADFYAPIGHTHLSLEGANYVSETITAGGTWVILNVSGLTVKESTTLIQSFTAVK